MANRDTAGRKRTIPVGVADAVFRAMGSPRGRWADAAAVVGGSAFVATVADGRDRGRGRTKRDSRIRGEAEAARVFGATAAERRRVAGAVASAHRILLDEAFLRAAMPWMALHDPARIAAALAMARLPGDAVFLEFALDDLASAVARHDGTPVPAFSGGQGVGIMLERAVMGTATAWSATVFRSGAAGVSVCPFRFHVEPSGMPLPAVISSGGDAARLLPPGTLHACLGVADPGGADVRFLVPEGYGNSVGLDYAPLYTTALGGRAVAAREAAVPDGGSDARMTEALLRERGMVRMAVAALATLEALPHASTPAGDGSGRSVLALALPSDGAGAFAAALDAAAARAGKASPSRGWHGPGDAGRGTGRIPAAATSATVADPCMSIARPPDPPPPEGALARLARMLGRGAVRPTRPSA